MTLNRSQKRALAINLGGMLFAVAIILGFDLGDRSALVSALLGVWMTVVFVWVLRDEGALKSHRPKGGLDRRASRSRARPDA